MYTPGSRRWWALGAIILAILAIGLDQTVLNLALPTLASSFQASEAGRIGAPSSLSPSISYWPNDAT